MALKHEEVYKFPVQIDVKTIGKAELQGTDSASSDADFRSCITDVITQYLSSGQICSQRDRPSRNSRYVSITTTVLFHSRAELDQVRQALTDHPRVLWLL